MTPTKRLPGDGVACHGKAIGDILAKAKRIAASPAAEIATLAGAKTAGTLDAAHLRAECEQRPVTAGHVTIWPIGTRPPVASNEGARS